MKLTTTQKGPFIITSDPTWPSIVFETDATGPHTWHWTISWKHFPPKSGTASTPGNQWDAKDAIKNLGGTLTVKATAGKHSHNMSVHVHGTNPSSDQVKQYLTTQPNGDVFFKILEHESHFKQFRDNGEPVVSFDGGYGMAQLTSPHPTYEQAWNWKLNVDGGLRLFSTKVQTAKDYLGQHGRKYTDDQLNYEAVCRYNGGSYHVWNQRQGWVRNPNILCDRRTGNIGWDMRNSNNAGKTQAQLHKRDAASYGRGRQSTDPWIYSGICYADAILGAPAAPHPHPAFPHRHWLTPQHRLRQLSSLWINGNGDLVHPDAPLGGGGLGFFAAAGPVSLDSFIAVGLPDPRSPAVRTLDPLEIKKRETA